MRGTEGAAARSWEEAERFDARTRALIEMFGQEPAGIANVALMASDFLVEQYGGSARWADLDVSALEARLPPPLARVVRSVRAALDAFVAVAIEHEGRALPEPRGDGYYLSAVDTDAEVGTLSMPFFPLEALCTCETDDGAPNRTERRFRARLARLAARKRPPRRR